MDLAEKYRPDEISGMIGGEIYEKSLFSALEAGAHSFLFTGSSGTGKTTLARCLAKLVEADIIELDAATHGNVEVARTLSQLAGQESLISKRTMIILDEAHAASASAWQALLKAVEEPRGGVYWALCTTEEGKVPNTIRSRCTHIRLQDCWVGDLEDHLMEIVKKEGMETSSKVVDVCAKQAHGSPRQALQNLSIAWSAKDNKEAAEILASPDETPEMEQFCRALIDGTTWEHSRRLLFFMVAKDPESIRLGILHYTLFALRGSEGDKTQRLLAILDAFSEPCRRGEGLTPLILALARLTLED